MSISVNFPFALSTGSLGYLEETADVKQAIRANVRSLILTNWGERLMHYDLGFNLREFLFEQRTPALKGRIADRAQAQLSRWMPFVKLKNIRVTFDNEDSSVPPNGFGLFLELSYGNVTIEAFQTFPV